MTERDLDTHPYDAQERWVCTYLQRITPEIGCGDDPVGFLIASHGASRADDERLRAAAEKVNMEWGCDTPDMMAEEILKLRAKLAGLESCGADAIQALRACRANSSLSIGQRTLLNEALTKMFAEQDRWWAGPSRDPEKVKGRTDPSV